MPRRDPDAPVVCLDADLDVTAEALIRRCSRRLGAGTALAACGQMDVDTSGVAPAVRVFYQGWRTNPYFTRGKFGGLFALSPEGAARVFPLPEITADDEYIRRSFAPAEIAFVAGCRFVARAPRTLASLVRVRRRSLRGAREVARMGNGKPRTGQRAVDDPAGFSRAGRSAACRGVPRRLGLGAAVADLRPRNDDTPLGT
jgi:hypothetical protein